MQTGILDKTRLTANILMIILVCLNIFFSVNYINDMKTKEAVAASEEQQSQMRYKSAKFTKLFVEKVLSSNGVIPFEDRIKLENDVRDLGDSAIMAQWKELVGSTGKDSEIAQQNVVKLLVLLANKMI